MGATAPVRLGLIGAGRWGRNYIRTVAGLEGVELAWVASGNPDTPALAPPETRVDPNWLELLSGEAVDGVIVATPPATHAEIVIAVLDSGRAALVEKPLVARRDELHAIERAAARSQAAIIVDHTHLFHPAFRALKRECAARGGALAIRSSAANTGPYRRDVSVLWDWAPHDVAMALDLVPGPARVVGAELVERRYVDGIAADRLRLALALAGDIPCDVTVSSLDPRHRWFAVDVDAGTLIYMDPAPEPLRWFNRRGAGASERGEAISATSGLPLTIVVEEFTQAIREGRRDRESLVLGCQVVDIIARCEESLQQ